MTRRALLIGIDGYNLLGQLKYARGDAEAFAEALCDHCGFTDQDITLMSCSGEGGTLALSRYIEHGLADLTEHRDLDLLVFGFWGHGFAPQPGKRYLCGLDAAEHDLERTAVSFDVVKAKLAQVQAENTLLVLDCCQNRPTGRSASAEPMTEGEEVALSGMARDIQTAHREKVMDTVPTVAILNACREGQKAYEWDSRGHGIFTAHLLDAFGRGFTSVAPLSSWVFERVTKSARDLHHQPQTPYVVIEGRGDVPLRAAPHKTVSTSSQGQELGATASGRGDADKTTLSTAPTKSTTETVTRSPDLPEAVGPAAGVAGLFTGAAMFFLLQGIAIYVSPAHWWKSWFFELSVFLATMCLGVLAGGGVMSAIEEAAKHAENPAAEAVSLCVGIVTGLIVAATITVASGGVYHLEEVVVDKGFLGLFPKTAHKRFLNVSGMFGGALAGLVAGVIGGAIAFGMTGETD